jgi:hypothetical protein
MSLFGESREAVANRVSLLNAAHDLAIQEKDEHIRRLDGEVTSLKHKLELAIAASRRWERMHDREHQERKWLENRLASYKVAPPSSSSWVALPETLRAPGVPYFDRLEVVPQHVPEIAPEADPLNVEWVQMTPQEIAAHVTQDPPKRGRGRPRKLDAVPPGLELPE